MNDKKCNLEKDLNSLLDEMGKIGPVMRGSVTIMGKKNKQPYFSVGIKGKTKVMYLGDKRAGIARKYSENYKRLLEIAEEMTIINMEILKLTSIESLFP